MIGEVGRWYNADWLLSTERDKKSNRYREIAPRTHSETHGYQHRSSVRPITKRPSCDYVPQPLTPDMSPGEIFLNQSKQLTSLSRQEEQDLLRIVALKKEAELDFSDEINQLIEGNIGYAIFMSMHFYRKAYNFFRPDDRFVELVSVAVISMHERLSRMPEPERGGSIADRVRGSMRRDLLRYTIQEKIGKFHHIPTEYIDLYSRYLKLLNIFHKKHHREPTFSEIIDAMICKSCSREQAVTLVRNILPMVGSVMYLSQTLSREDNDSDTVLDTVVGEFNEVMNSVLSGDLQSRISAGLDKLSSREKQVLELRFGIADDREHTLQEIGDCFGFSRERARQIEAVALRRMRHPGRGGRGLRAYYD